MKIKRFCGGVGVGCGVCSKAVRRAVCNKLDRGSHRCSILKTLIEHGDLQFARIKTSEQREKPSGVETTLLGIERGNNA